MTPPPPMPDMTARAMSNVSTIVPAISEFNNGKIGLWMHFNSIPSSSEESPHCKNPLVPQGYLIRGSQGWFSKSAKSDAALTETTEITKYLNFILLL
jgi:hypothetical protein